jgi:hypothetical protein
MASIKKPNKAKKTYLAIDKTKEKDRFGKKLVARKSKKMMALKK